MRDLIEETVDHVRLLRLDRPERKNALTASLGWVRRTKHLVARTPLMADVDARMVDEIRAARAGLNREDGQEPVRAIMEKRAPQFHGR